MLGSEGLRGLARTLPTELEQHEGVGPAKAATLLAALELGRRLSERRLENGDPIRGPEDVFQHFHARLRDIPHEQFHLLLLDGRHRVLREVMASRGTLTASLVHPREVFRPALREGAAALVVVHNHPSGDPAPSQEGSGGHAPPGPGRRLARGAAPRPRRGRRARLGQPARRE
jgi:DNA repair protein RadC